MSGPMKTPYFHTILFFGTNVDIISKLPRFKLHSLKMWCGKFYLIRVIRTISFIFFKKQKYAFFCVFGPDSCKMKNFEIFENIVLITRIRWNLAHHIFRLGSLKWESFEIISTFVPEKRMVYKYGVFINPEIKYKWSPFWN